MPRQQFGVVGQGDGPYELACLAVLPAAAFHAKPGFQIGLGWPFAFFFKGLQQLPGFRLFVRVVASRAPQYVDVETVKGLQAVGILLGCANARVRRAARVAGKARRTARPLLEHFDKARIAQQGSQPSQLVVHQRIHGIHNQCAHGRESAEGKIRFCRNRSRS